jgi:hypothetical protein
MDHPSDPPVGDHIGEAGDVGSGEVRGRGGATSASPPTGRVVRFFHSMNDNTDPSEVVDAIQALVRELHDDALRH